MTTEPDTSMSVAEEPLTFTFSGHTGVEVCRIAPDEKGGYVLTLTNCTVEEAAKGFVEAVNAQMGGNNHD